MLGYPFEDTSLYPPIEPLHILGIEGRLESTDVIDHDPERPNIALGIIGLIPPDLRTGIIGRSRLRIRQRILHDRRYVHIAQLVLAVADEHVRRFQIAVDYF